VTYAFNYLLDENVNVALAEFLAFHHPDLPFRSIGEAPAPPKGTLDPDVLRWCEAHDSVLLTNNRKSMPLHLVDHVAAGRHVQGIFQIPTTMTVVELGEHLVMVAGGSFPGEYSDQIHYLPIV
jgi:hypothetical protein